MTLVPEKPRSELVTPTKPCGAGVCEILRMFQIASPASWSPAFNPTRGSGDGARSSGADMSGWRDAPGPVDIVLVDEEPAQAEISAAARRAKGERVISGVEEGVWLLGCSAARLLGCSAARRLGSSP